MSNSPIDSITDDLVRSAAALKRPAVERLLTAHYPRICRMAYAICGRENRGRQAVRQTIRKSLAVLPKWESALAASNWFLHHTILEARAAAVESDASEDCLIRRVDKPSPEYVAFVRAVRNLPQQQQEAIFLARGEKLEPRQVSVAMDCSTSAAANHLIAANRTLSTLSVGGFDAAIDSLGRVYASLTPPEALILGDIGSIGRKLARRRIRRAILTILVLAVLGITAWAVWRLSTMIVT